MNSRQSFRSARRKMAWLFLGLWTAVLTLAVVRRATHGDMTVTVAVAAAAVAFCLHRLYTACRTEK